MPNCKFLHELSSWIRKRCYVSFMVCTLLIFVEYLDWKSFFPVYYMRYFLCHYMFWEYNLQTYVSLVTVNENWLPRQEATLPISPHSNLSHFGFSSHIKPLVCNANQFQDPFFRNSIPIKCFRYWNQTMFTTFFFMYSVDRR